MNYLLPYLMSFISMFVAVNAFGILPLFIGMTERSTQRERGRILFDSVVTATLIALLFTFTGKLIFHIMGISVSDFKIAGGVLLFILSIHLLLPGETKRGQPSTDVGIFPLGTPLITGPAVLTTTIMLLDTYGLFPTLASLILNMAVVWIVFYNSKYIIKVFGISGTKAFSKVADIFLAAIAVMMVRSGLLEILEKIKWAG